MATYYYCRVSTVDQNATNQIQALSERYTQPDGIYIDSGVSGSKPALKRPEFLKLFNLLQPGDVVIATAIDRLGRKSLDVVGLVEKLTAMGVSLVSMREGVDFSTPTGKLVLTVLAAVAEMERENNIERTKQGLANAKAQGKQLGKPADLALYERIQELYKQGMRKTEISRTLNVSRPTVDRALKMP